MVELQAMEAGKVAKIPRFRLHSMMVIFADSADLHKLLRWKEQMQLDVQQRNQRTELPHS